VKQYDLTAGVAHEDSAAILARILSGERRYEFAAFLIDCAKACGALQDLRQFCQKAPDGN
jgi:predicted secreted protein